MGKLLVSELLAPWETSISMSSELKCRYVSGHILDLLVQMLSVELEICILNRSPGDLLCEHPEISLVPCPNQGLRILGKSPGMQLTPTLAGMQVVSLPGDSQQLLTPLGPSGISDT